MKHRGDRGRHRNGLPWISSAEWLARPTTFVYVVQVGLLAHGGQQVQDTGVDADFVIAAVLPGVVLDHIEKLPNKKQDPMFRMILVEKQTQRNDPRHAVEGGRKNPKPDQSRPHDTLQLWRG